MDEEGVVVRFASGLVVTVEEWEACWVARRGGEGELRVGVDILAALSLAG